MIPLLWLALLIFPLTPRQASPMPAGTSTIGGQVLAADTGKPLRGALVEIVIYENLSGRFRQVTTDVQGKFEFTNLPPGHFQIAASATRYMRMQYGQQQPGPVSLLNPARTIDLADAVRFTAANFSLSPFGAIEGTVIDEFGDPVPNVMIQVSQLQYAGGRRRLFPVNPSTDAGPPRATNDKGEFRIAGLAPGDYYVEALSGAFADANAAGGFAVTFFPGTADVGAAEVVSVSPGHDAVGMSFPLVPAPMARVSGTLLDGDGRPVTRGNMMLMPSETAAGSLFVMAPTTPGESGRFTFRNVPPGTYTIQAFGAPVGPGNNLAAAAFGYRTFTVDGRDTDDLTVKVPAPRTLRGHISFEEDTAAKPKPAEISLAARQIDFESAPVSGGPAPVTIHDDYTFEIRAMSGLRVVTAITRQGWLLRSTTLAGQDVTDTPIDLREHDVNDLEITLTTRATTVTGSVIGPDDKAPADYNVVIFADDETKWGLWSRYVSFVRAGQQGTFTVRGLPAGSYTAVAVSALVNGEWQNPAFLKKQRASVDATRFSLAEGQSTTLQLRLRR